MEISSRIRFETAQGPTNWLDFLQDHFALSKSACEELLRLGAIYCNQKRWPQADPLSNAITPTSQLPLFQADDVIRVHLQPKRFPLSQLQKIQILEDQPDWVAVWKPAGIPAHATLDNQIENSKTYAETLLQIPLWGLTRLDVGTRGVLMLAKSARAARELNETVLPQAEKIYEALSSGTIGKPMGTWIHWMKKSDRAPREVSREQHGDFQIRCELEILSRVAVPAAHATLAHQSIRLLTGRTHQIRVQLAHEQSPILGDPMYGPGPCLNPDFEEFALSCESLSGDYRGQRFSVSRPQGVAPLIDAFSI
ncbi:MAG: pseudouridine synthase [Bdellovibrio sp.]